jgi:hypothetical protein
MVVTINGTTGITTVGITASGAATLSDTDVSGPLTGNVLHGRSADRGPRNGSRDCGDTNA